MVAESSSVLAGEGLRTSAFDASQTQEPPICFHCGSACRDATFRSGEKAFCCHGCQTVFELLSENGLTEYYSLNTRAGVRVSAGEGNRFAYLDEAAVRERLVDFQGGKTTRITFRLPAIHCIACVWLLENLFRLRPGIGATRVNFPRKEAAISFDHTAIRLSEVAGVLASLGYAPELNFSDLEPQKKTPANRRLALQLGVAGFAFGNNMLFSIALYFGVDVFSGPGFQKLVGWISMALALPVLLFSAQDYFRLAWTGLKHKLLTIEVPIAAGILVIFGQSAFEVLSGRGPGYFDSFAGLLFFLLCGRLFQQKTYDRLTFDRDFKSFFPLSITRIEEGAEGPVSRPVSLSQLRAGDQLLIRNGEIIPADSRLVRGRALIDYSFVTGEAEPLEKAPGDHLYAGGRQIGTAITVETVKAVSQSYLTSLWNQDAFLKSGGDSLDTLINRYSQRFTKAILGIAAAAALYWAFGDAQLALRAFTSVLIVACPCALALAAPFTLGTAIRVLGGAGAFVKAGNVIERLARVDAIVFDKTGTLTAAGAGSVHFDGAPLSAREQELAGALARHSTHPCAVRIGRTLKPSVAVVRSFREVPGCGMEGNVEGHEILMGSGAWLQSRGVEIRGGAGVSGTIVHLAIDGRDRGAFVLTSALRPDAEELLRELSGYDLALLSGDNEKERERFRAVFGPAAELRFNQAPPEKLEFIASLQKRGRTVMMVGDGLNDAGALKQSDVGVAVVENIGAFSPASDIILGGEAVPRIGNILRFSKGAVKIVRWSFLLSAIYNAAGISIAASGGLSPVVCAILMPASSISVVVFASAATAWLGKRAGLTRGGEAR